MSGLNEIFHLCVHSEILLRSSFNTFAERVGLYIVENKEVSSANNLTNEFKLLGKLVMQIGNSSGPRMEPFGTPARIGAQSEC